MEVKSSAKHENILTLHLNSEQMEVLRSVLGCVFTNGYLGNISYQIFSQLYDKTTGEYDYLIKHSKCSNKHLEFEELPNQETKSISRTEALEQIKEILSKIGA
jgi:hypothetical protein